MVEQEEETPLHVAPAVIEDHATITTIVEWDLNHQQEERPIPMTAADKLLCVTVELKLYNGQFRRADRTKGSSFSLVPNQEKNNVVSLNGQTTFHRVTSGKLPEEVGCLGLGGVVEDVEWVGPRVGQQSHRVSVQVMALPVVRELLPLVASVDNRDTPNDRALRPNNYHDHESLTTVSGQSQ